MHGATIGKTYLFILHCPVDLVVVTSAQVNHDVLVPTIIYIIHPRSLRVLVNLENCSLFLCIDYLLSPLLGTKKRKKKL